MNRKKFIKRLATKRKITMIEAERELEAFFDILAEGLREEGTVRLNRIGKFEIKTTKERMGRNPKTGQEYKIPPLKKVKFTVSNGLINKIEKENKNMRQEVKVHNCDRCESIRMYDNGKRIYYCDNEDRADDMGKIGVGDIPEICPEWCPIYGKEIL